MDTALSNVYTTGQSRTTQSVESAVAKHRSECLARLEGAAAVSKCGKRGKRKSR